jgi:hypothetical protein
MQRVAQARGAPFPLVDRQAATQLGALLTFPPARHSEASEATAARMSDVLDRREVARIYYIICARN